MFDWSLYSKMWYHAVDLYIYFAEFGSSYAAYLCLLPRMGKAHFILRPKLHAPLLQTIFICILPAREWQFRFTMCVWCTWYIHVHVHRTRNVLHISITIIIFMQSIRVAVNYFCLVLSCQLEPPSCLLRAWDISSDLWGNIEPCVEFIL